MSIHEIVTMGGYGAYVWTAYTLTFMVFTVLLGICKHEGKRIQKQVQLYYKQLATHES
jgi:heme exporter protein CcmD